MAKRELRCEIEISFLEGPVFHGMSPPAWKIYTYLWGKAVNERKEDLFGVSSVYIGNKTGIRPNKITGYLRELAGINQGYKGDKPEISRGSPLILMSIPSLSPAIHDLSLLNVSNKHPNLKNIKKTSRYDYENRKTLPFKNKPNQTRPKKTKPKLPSAQKPEQISPVTQFKEFWYREYQQIIGQPYHIQAEGGDAAFGAAVKRLIATYGLEDLQHRAIDYLRDGDEYIVKNGHRLSTFEKKVMKYGEVQGKRHDFSGAEKFLAKRGAEDVE